MRIAVDAMGGDHAPLVNVDGAVAAAREFGIGSLLVGKSAELEPLLRESGYTGSDIEIVDAPEVVTMDDPATAAIRKKRNSSIRIAANCVRDGRAAGSSRPATRAPPWSAGRWSSGRSKGSTGRPSRRSCPT